MSIVNPSLAAFLLPDEQRPRCVSVSYEKTAVGGKLQGSDIKSFKTFNRDLKPEDFVIIPTDTRWGFTIGRVEAVDLIVNYTSSEEMRWVGDVFDKKTYDNILARERALVGNVTKATEAKARRELMDELQAIDPSLSTFMLTGPEAGDEPALEPAQRGGAQAGAKLD